jgi:hypothetical protein
MSVQKRFKDNYTKVDFIIVLRVLKKSKLNRSFIGPSYVVLFLDLLRSRWVRFTGPINIGPV